jgi:PAS domain S-box-containing protein
MPSIAELIEQHRAHIQQCYLEEASRLPSAQGVRPQEILDNLPGYLSVLSALSRGQRVDPSHTKRRLEETHIGLRLRLGYTLEDATAEFVLLGRLLSRLWESLPAHQQPTPEDTQLLFDALQTAMEHTVTVFSGYSLEDRQTEKRALHRMDVLAADLLDSPEPSVPLAERLASLLTVVREALRAEASTVLLADPDGQRLHPTASSGLWRTPPDSQPVPVHAPSFVAELASCPEVLHLPDATTTHFALGEGVRASGIHSLLGLRMCSRGRLLGVVYLGIAEARPFEPRARRLLETLVEHLASIVDRARLLQELRQANARLLESEARHQGPITCDASGQPVHRLGAVQDISQRIATFEAEITERERNRATSILESISDAFFAVDRKWRFIYVNREAERLLGHPREALLGRDHWEVFPATQGTILERSYRRAATERIPLTFEDQDPKGVWLEVRVYPTEQGLAVFFRDISERKRAEQFREPLIGIVSHDLRNPLNSIVLSAEVLLHREDVPETLLAPVRRIARSADRMARMITDLLDFTRSRLGGGIPLRREPTELVELVCTTLEEFEVMHPGRIVLTHDRGPYIGEWDKDRLAQVISNLVGNALQHGAAGTPVEVTLRDHCPEVVLSVTNQGPPIPEALLPHIFDPFRRSEHGGRQGLGLGLYIVQQIVLAHGGSISVSSSEASGTTFAVRLPCEPTRP